MLAPPELGWDLGLYAREWLAERMRVTADLAAAAAREPTTAHVHRLRVSCRRLREAIAFFTGAPEMPPLGSVERAVRRTMRAVQKLRELDVARNRLAALGDGPLDADTERARADLLQRLARRRGRLERRKRFRIQRRARKLLRVLGAGALRHPTHATGAPSPTGSDPGIATVEIRTRAFLETRMAQRRAAIEELCARLGSAGGGARRHEGEDRREPHDALHRARVAIKHWRYASEIGRPAVARDRYRVLAATLRALHDLGGESQDMADLARLVEAETYAAPPKRRARLDLLLQIVVAAREAAASDFRDALQVALTTTPLASRLSVARV